MHMVILMSYIKYANILGISIYFCIHYTDTLGDFNALHVCVHCIHIHGHLTDINIIFLLNPNTIFFNS